MGKLKTTVASIKSAYAPKYIFKTGYCNVQTLFHYTEPKAYTCGTYGWNFDLYDVDGVGICTGYRNMVGNQIDYDTVQDFEHRAEHILHGNEVAWEDKRTKLEELQKEFVKAIRASVQG